jgi:expansin (peptidoglycan-binding protein)
LICWYVFETNNFYIGCDLKMNIKKIVSCFILVTFVQLAFSASFAEEGKSVIGDVTGDNLVNSVDYAYLRQYLLGIIDDFPVEDDLWAADVNGDGEINSVDFGYLRSFLLGKIDKLPKDSAPTSTESYPDWEREHSGYATFTGSGYSGGSALLDPIPDDMEITALNPEDYNSYGVDAALAGAYLEVTGDKGSTIVYVTDLYPEGAPGALDLCPTSFDKIGDMSKGKIDIKWHVVAAPVTGNVSYRIKEGSTRAWLAIQVRNHKYPVLKMECYTNGTWKDMKKMFWNHFIAEGLDSTDVQIRITDIRGYVLTDVVKGIPEPGDTREAYIVDGNVQFPD